MNTYVKLAEDRVEKFDNQATAVHTTGPIKEIVNRFISRDDLVLVDVGGGNGTFMDQLLLDFPNARGVNVELSPGMCKKNNVSVRKEVFCANFIEWAERQARNKRKVDVVFFNFVLHHFVSRGYAESISLQKTALEAASRIIADDGMIVVYEINYNGAWIDDLPSKLIHFLTSSRWMAPLIKALGANTAGYGVCFHSEKFWKSTYGCVGMSVVHQHIIDRGVFKGIRPTLHKLGLHIGSMNYQISFLKKSA